MAILIERKINLFFVDVFFSMLMMVRIPDFFLD